MYNLSELRSINSEYDRKYQMTQEDVDRVNGIIEKLEARDHSKPAEGDIIICKNGRGVVYRGGLLQTIDYLGKNGCMNICVRPYIPHIDIDLCISASGGYWMTPINPFLKFIELKMREFWIFGSVGPCAGGAVKFLAAVAAWEYISDDVY